jgi:beta-glucuronidase
MGNSLEQLRELIASARNHPSVVAWGLCNEIGGQREVAHRYVRALYAEAKKLDPRRPCTYASNSLTKTPERDAVGLVDFISWNEYYESWYKGTPADMRRNLEEIVRAFPGKPVVISEYGYCACTAERPEDDRRRVEILRTHNRIFREFPAVGGLIFFCYNDYRTHIGDKGHRALRQRVHGVVDLYGARKPSFEALRTESGPVEAVTVLGAPPSLRIEVETRRTVPGYVLSGYLVRVTAYGVGDIPLEEMDAPLPTLKPGDRAAVDVLLRQAGLRRARIDIVRPTGFSAATAEWKA